MSMSYSVTDERGVRISIHGCKNGLGLLNTFILAFVRVTSCSIQGLK